MCLCSCLPAAGGFAFPDCDPITQTVEKVPSSRHVRMDGTQPGKFGAESVRGRKAECAVRRQILSPGTAKLRRVQRTKQPKRSRGSGLSFSSAIPGAQKMQGTATIRGKEFLSRDCAQKWVPPKACRFSTRCVIPSLRRHRCKRYNEINL